MASSSPTVTPYDSWTQDDLIKRVTQLEQELKAQNEKFLALLPSTTTAPSLAQQTTTLHPDITTPPPKPKKKAASFDPTKYHTRHIALKFAYLGARYNGFEQHIGNATPLPTIEGELWKALVKTKLIFPPSLSGLEVAEEENREFMRKDLTKAEWFEGGVVGDWRGVGYSKCGRTDRGVSAFGQVIGLRVRSARKVEKKGMKECDGQGSDAGKTTEELREEENGATHEVESEDAVEEPRTAPLNPVTDELPYIALLNRVLPPDIRILAWCPHPPSNFDARFSCKERKYRYFFTSPAFLPLPGPVGLSKDGRREGWLDIEAMREAAGYLQGTHDFRNLCKVDPTKQLTSFTRRITYAGITQVGNSPSPEFIRDAGLTGSGNGDLESQDMKLYTFDVQGSAFLWHQVRCMVAILFLIGQGLESPTLIKELLDVEKNPRKPQYEMASDQPLVLWDCMFSADADKGKFAEGEKPQGYIDRGVGVDELDWIYAADADPVATPNQSKWGPMGLMTDAWKGWRKAKIDEVLAAQLLDMVAGQGKPAAESEAALATSKRPAKENQRVFDGHDFAAPKGQYVPVMKKQRMDPVDVINARWAARKGRPGRLPPAGFEGLD